MRGYYFSMDLSEFTPPARLSLTDQEISQRLGAATADEAGMIAAMDFLEEQTALRDQDNKATDEWLARMRESSDPRASIALTNFERQKQGLEPLPLVPPVPEYPVFNNPPAESNPEETPIVLESEPTNEGSAEAAAEEFEELLQTTEPASEAEPEVIQESTEVPPPLEEIPAPVVRGFRLVSAANWILGIGVLAPATAAVISAINGLNFVTSMLAGLVGILVGVKVNVLGLLTARRTHRGLAVATRSTFGVFGAIIPGLFVLLAGFGAVAVIAFASGKYFNNTIVGLSDFSEPLMSIGEFPISLAILVPLGLVLVAAILAVFGGGFARWTKITLGGLVLGGFLAFAIFTISGIDYLNLAGVFQTGEFLIVAPIFALSVSVLAYGLDGESLAAAAWGAKRKSLTWPIFVFGFVLPFLTYGHFAALLNGHDFADGSEVIQFLLSAGNQVSATILVDGAIVSVIGLLFVGISKLIEALKTMGTNHIGYGLATLAAALVALFVASIAFVAAEPLVWSLNLTAVLLVPAAAWVGFAMAETLMRRGRYHDASLTRSYGFYGSVNWVAMLGYVVLVAFAFSIIQPLPGFAWLGFLIGNIGFSLSSTFGALSLMIASIIFTLATGFPRIIRQQRETKAVEDRRFDLVDVVVD